MNATLASCPLFSFLGGYNSKATVKPPKSDEGVKKKWAIGQSCIRNEVTSYKIHTLDFNQKNINFIVIHYLMM